MDSTAITPALKTDHAAIELVLTNSRQEAKGPGYWKMNVSLLEDENYFSNLKDNIPEWKRLGVESLSDKRSIWDWLKYNIRNHAISYSKQKAKEHNRKLTELQTAYEATKKFEEDPTPMNQNCLNEAKEIFEHFYEEKLKA